MKKPLRFIKLIILLSVFISSGLKAQGTCIALASGSWTNAGTWSCGAVPNCGDSIVIPAGITVSNTTQQDYTGCAQPMKLVIFGKLSFQNGFKLKLPCNSKVWVFAGGVIEAGGGGGNANYIEICGVTVWNAGQGNYVGPACLPPPPAACNASTFPVELVDFTAENRFDQVHLEWNTASEKNNWKFEIERGTDAMNFEKIGEVHSKAPNGSTSGPLDYYFSDAYPLNGISYYRLKQIDKDLTFEHSNIISVNSGKEKDIRFAISHNSISHEFTANIAGIALNQQVIVLIRDVQGKLVYKKSFFMEEGKNQLILHPENSLDRGIYVCTLFVGEESITVKTPVH